MRILVVETFNKRARDLEKTLNYLIKCTTLIDE